MTSYRIENPMDEYTCDACRAMHGRKVEDPKDGPPFVCQDQLPSGKWRKRDDRQLCRCRMVKE